MKIVKILLGLLILFVFCGTVFGADTDDTQNALENTTLYNEISIESNELENIIMLNNEDSLPTANDESGGPIPEVEIDGYDEGEPVNTLINETFEFNLLFHNSGNEIGYQPYLEVIFPKELTDLQFTYLNHELTIVDVGVFSQENDYTLIDPYTNKEVKGSDGERFILVLSPLGSYSSEIPDATIHVSGFLNTTNIENLLNLTVTPIFRFGADPLDNPTTDPPIYGESVIGWIKPNVVQVEIDTPVHEYETVTGPNFPYMYNITVNIANGANVEDIVITNTIPSQLYFINNTNYRVKIYDKDGNEIDPSLYEVILPDSNYTGGTLTIKFDSYKGSDVYDDILIEYWVYAPEFDNSTGINMTILNPVSGENNITTNYVEIECEYDNVNCNDNDDVIVTLKSLAVQKYVDADSTVYPHQILDYTIYFEVSDYFSFRDFYFLDHAGELPMGAGQDFIWDSVYLTFNNRTYKLENETYYSYADLVPNDGHWDLLIYVSRYLQNNNIISNLEGGYYSDRGVNNGALVGYVEYSVRVNLNYIVGNETISADDLIINIADGIGVLLNSGAGVNDSSRTQLRVPSPVINKEIVAVDGVLVEHDYVTVHPGQNVTFLLDIYLPTGTIDDFSLTDFFPIPLFDVAGFEIRNTTNYVLPLAGHWSYAEGSDFVHDIYGNIVSPEVSFNTAENFISFHFGNTLFNESANLNLMLWVTLQVTHDPMADELNLANLLYMYYTDSVNTTYMAAEIVHMLTQEPDLTIQKEVNTTYVENNTHVQYTIFIENIGHSSAFDLIVTDNFLELYSELIKNGTTVGQIVRIYASYGNGTIIDIDANDFFNTSKGYYIGYLGSTETSGSTNLTIVYEVVFNDHVYVNQMIENTANITNFASRIDGDNFVNNPDRYSDSAFVMGESIEIDKEFIGSDDFSSNWEFLLNGADRKQNLTIGESGIFDIVVDLPELIVNNLTIVDYVTGLKLLDFAIYLNNTIVTSANASDYNINYLITNTDTGSNIRIVFNGNSEIYSDNSQITIRLFYVVLNSSVNPSTGSYYRINTVEAYIGNDTRAYARDQESVLIVQPLINIIKEFIDERVEGGDYTGFHITFINSGNSPLYNITITDDLSGLLEFVDNLSNVNITIHHNDGENLQYSINNNTITFTLDKLESREYVLVYFTFIVREDIIIGSEYTNVASATGTSLPNDLYNETRDYYSSDRDTLETVLPTIDKEVIDSTIDNGRTNATIGEDVLWQITVDLPTGNYTSLVITDILPVGMDFINGTVYINGTPSTEYLIIYDQNNRRFTVEFNNISSAQLGGRITILFNTTITDSTSNYEGVTKTNTVTLRLNNVQVDQSSANIRIVEPNIIVDKSSDKTKYEYNETVEYTIIIENTGNTHGFNIVVIDKLPEGLIYNYESSISTDDGWTMSYDENTRTFTITGNVLEVGENIVFRYNCTFDLNHSDLLGNDFVNTVNVTHSSANRTDIYRDYFVEDDNLVHVISVDLVVDKVLNNTVLIAGESVYYNITVVNNGPDDALNVVLFENPQREDLSEIQYRIGSTGEWTNLSEDGLIRLGTLTNGQSVLIQFRATINSDALGNLTNFVDVSTTTNETDYSNNNDTVIEEIDTIAELNIVKVTNSTIVIAGTEIYYNVTVSNNGPSVARDVILRDYFNTNDLTNMQYSFDGTNWFNYENGNDINLGDLAVGDSRTVFFRALVNASTRGTIYNTANITTTTPNTGNNSSHVENEVVSDVVITIDKIANVTEVNPGEYISYIIYINFTGNSASENVQLKDLLNTTLLDVENATYSINGVNMGIWTGNILLGSTIASPSYFTIEISNIRVKATADRDIPNIATVTTDDYPEGENSSCNIHVNIVDLAIDKDVISFGNYSEEIVYIIVVNNNGPDTSTNVVVSDLLPDGLNYVSSTATKGEYDPNTGIWNVGSLNPFQYEYLTIVATINKTGEIVNNASVTGDGHDSNESNNNDSVEVEIPVAADVVIDKVIISSGNYLDEIIYSIVVTNNGPDMATGIIASDILPNSLIYVSSESTVGSYNSTSGIWNIGSLNPGESVNLIIVAIINRTGEIINSANVTANEYDPNLTNNNDSVNVEIPPTIDLALDKVVISYGNYSDEIIYLIVVNNNGPDLATGVLVSDILPESLNYLSYYTDRGSYNVSSGLWNIGSLEVGESVNITIIASINGTGIIVNHANVTGNEYEIITSNNNDTETVEIPPEVDIVVNKTAEGSFILWDNMTYVIVVTNQGIDLATNVSLTDVLPESLIHIGSVATKGEYNPVTGIWNIGELAAGENATLYINCTINQTGNIINEAFANSTEHDLNYTNNNDTVIIEIPPVADLEVIKVSDVVEVTVGNQVIFIITVINHGPDTAINVTATDKLPDGLEFIGYNATRGVFDPETGIWVIGDLEAGENATLIIVTVAIKDGIIVNNVTVNSSTMDLNESNNNDSVEVLVNPLPCEESNITTINPTKEMEIEKTKIIMEKTGNPFIIAAVLLVFLLGLGVKGRKK